LPCAFRLRYRSAFNAVNRRKVTVVASQRQIQRRFVRIPVGGSRNESAALKRSASHLDKQDDFKVDWLYTKILCSATSGKALSINLKNTGQPVFRFVDYKSV
jgi:hypothetical protein